MSLTIVADENIAMLDVVEAHWGQITRLPGRLISARDVQDADILLVRSVTQVNAHLLENSDVRFVGTATIGEEHIDQVYLQQRGISYASAPGCNALAVVDYVTAVLFYHYSNVDLLRLRVGIVGYGNTGSALASRLEALGIQYSIFDPFVQDVPNALESFDEILTCDVVSLHVPLTHSGEHPTYHMIDKDSLAALSSGTLLINTARGAVVDNGDLLAHFQRNTDLGLSVALDVWEGEPHIATNLLPMLSIATGHIAGYSRQGKERGTAMIVSAAASALGLPSVPFPCSLSPDAKSSTKALSLLEKLENMRCQLRAIVPLNEDSERFISSLSKAFSVEAVANAFDAYRKAYPLRDEIPAGGLF